NGDCAMKLALVSRPWAVHQRPSAATGALAAFVRSKLPCDVTVISEHVTVAVALRFPLYATLAQHAYKRGDTLFVPALYPDCEDRVRVAFVGEAETVFGSSTPGDLVDGSSSWDDVYAYTRRTLDEATEQLAERLADIDVVGLTTCFGQLFANLALARRLKKNNP